MSFQIHSLPAEDFSGLFALSDAELTDKNACRQIVKTKPGTPCRVSMADAEVGETVVLLNYEHQPAQSPYRATHESLSGRVLLKLNGQLARCPRFFDPVSYRYVYSTKIT